MHSTTQDLPGTGGSGAVARLRAALATIRAGVEEALSTPTTWVEVGELGALIGELEAEKARTDALTLAWVRQAEACDVGKTTGAATTAGWLRTAQRMSKTEASATVGLARDLDRTVTLTAAALARGELSLKHAQVIAFAVKDLPAYVGVEQRVKAEEYLIAWSKRRNPDDVRLLGRTTRSSTTEDGRYGWVTTATPSTSHRSGWTRTRKYDGHDACRRRPGGRPT
ncbi:DUF222 domain-containing protein [Actinopolymorpha rutila]|uniref:DUF222 domain-containing protein n=1 Tax=Actinopolymorpha rutila TaxID=446787 RepID=A0A852ZTB9_9ACTN|nr:DUF222 domain-containing protein [Actinopolymorpha rutila]NYH92629.1 hypothetical protein [Actinopolymorpha rutila]